MKRREGSEGKITRGQLRKRGYLAIGKHGDLHKYGYQIVLWMSPRRLTEGKRQAIVYEYAPIPGTPGQRFNLKRDLPRMTATNIREQRKVHKFLGAPTPEPGARVRTMAL